MRLHDISLALSPDTPVWPGDPRPSVYPIESIGAGQPFAVTGLELSAHTGTHIDAPSHCIPSGPAVDAIPIDALVGPCFVADLSALKAGSAIGARELETAPIPAGTRRLLLKTDNSRRLRGAGSAFFADYVALTDDACEWIVSRGIDLVGIDYLSVTTEAHSLSGHRILLGANVVILEGLDLSGIEPGSGELICLPLKVVGADGAPARAILVR
ncbi:MAG TPA: cyclase family protein [Treponemataceae bacterium]|nr:cyclase family protein [Treponemataceae bacterium]